MEIQNELQFYIKVFKRRTWLFVVPAVVAMFLCTLAALFLPAKYVSTGAILIETQDIPAELVQSTVTGLIEERIQGLNQVVLSRSNLLELINQFDLYTSERSSLSTSELVEQMRSDISIDMVTTEVHDSEKARSGVATFAFTLAFEGRNPQKVLQVANTLVTLYLEENINSREEKTRSAFEYLEGRLADIDDEINDVEEEVSMFKEEHKYTLPELFTTNVRILERVDGQVRMKKEEMERALSRVRYWGTELAARPQFIVVRTTGGQRLITPEEELDRMRRDYVSLLATRSEDHPDAQNLKKEIDALEEQLKHRQDLKVYQDDLADSENELREAQEKYTNQHPEVKSLKKSVAALQEDIRTLEDRYSIIAKKEDKEINPQWILAKNNRDTHQQDLDKLTQEYHQMSDMLLEVQTRIDDSPQVELLYSTIIGELETRRSERDELIKRMLSAKEAKGLEESGLGEKFTLIDPPILPEKPSKPNRPLLLGLGFVISLALGLASGAIAEFTDRAVHTQDELMSYSDTTVLAVIPYITSSADAGRTNKQRASSIVILLGVLTIGLISIHFIVVRLDVLWDKILLALGLF